MGNDLRIGMLGGAGRMGQMNLIGGTRKATQAIHSLKMFYLSQISHYLPKVNEMVYYFNNVNREMSLYWATRHSAVKGEINVCRATC